MKNTTINYAENAQLWKIEDIATENGYRKAADCYWAQIFENDNGDRINTVREDSADLDPVEAMKEAVKPEETEATEEEAEEIKEEEKENKTMKDNITIITSFPRKSKLEVWNIGEHNRPYTDQCLVPLVTCDEYYHVTSTIYLRVDSIEEAEIIMAAAPVDKRNRWSKYNKKWRSAEVRKAAEIIEKYYTTDII